MSVFWLKVFALVSMVIDHTAAVFTEAVPSPMLSGRAVALMGAAGRAAFPLYAFLLVEGFSHTRDWRKYALRLFGLGVFSQLPYAFTLNEWVAYSQMPWWRRVCDLNVLFTLTLGVLLLAFLRHTGRLDRAFGSWWMAGALAALAAAFYASTLQSTALALGVAAARFAPRLRPLAGQAARFVLFAFPFFWLLRRNIPLPGGGTFHFSFDYGFYGLVFFAALYWARTPRLRAAVIVCWGLWLFSEDFAGVLLAAVLVACYNGKRGPDDHRLFYWAYPAHLFLLWGARLLLG